MELSKTKKRKESAMDRLKVVPGSTLDVQGFLAQAPDPALAQEIVDALRACGLFDLCSFQVEGYYPRDVAEFYEKGTSQGSVFISRVNGQYVQITESDIRREFNLPESNLTVDNHAFNLRDFWNRIRGEGTSEEPKSTNIKKTILKRNFEMLVDILYKCIDGRIGSLDDVSTKNIGVLHAIMQKIKYNWARYIFNNIKVLMQKCRPIENDTFKVSSVGYGLLLSHLLKKKGINMRKGKNAAKYWKLFRPETGSKGGSSRDISASASVNSNTHSSVVKRRRTKKRVVEEEGSFAQPAKRVREAENEGGVNSSTPLRTLPGDHSPRVTEGIEEVVRATMDLETATAIQQEIDEEVATILPYEGMEGAAFDEDEGIIADGEDLNLVQDTDADLEKFVDDEKEEEEVQEHSELLEELERVKAWRIWRFTPYDELMAQASPAIKEDEIFSLRWLGTDDLTEATRLFKIYKVYFDKLYAIREVEAARKGKKAARKGKKADQFDDPSAEKQHPKEMVEAMRKSREEMYQPSGVLEQEDIEATYNREDMFNEEEAFEIHEERNDAGADQEAFVGGEVEDTVTVTVPQTEPTNRDGEKVGTTFIDPLTAIVPYNPSTQIAIELAEDTNVEAFPERMRSRSQICDPGQPTSISRLSSSESHREESPMDIPPVAPPPAKEHDIPLIPEPIFLVKGVALNDAINKLTTEFSSKKGEASSSAISALDDIKVKQDKFFGEIGCALRNLKDIEESRDAIIHQNLKNIVQKFRDFVAENDKDHKETRKKIQDNFTAVIRNQNELIQSQQNQIEELNAKLATVQDTMEMYFRDIQSKVKPVGKMQIYIEDIRRQQLLDSAILQSFDATKKGERSSQAGRSSTGRGGYSQSGRGQAGRGQGSRPICR